MSQSRQRRAIEQSLTKHSELSIIGEYTDILSGRYANRAGYQQMLTDARAGKFSHVAVENAERFGRNDAEALTVIDELDDLGIAIRFADYPDLDPVDPDDRILISLSFTLARRESIKLGQRTKRGLAILDKRSPGDARRRRHVYLLSGLIYLQNLDSLVMQRMTCSTSNPSRSGGGTSHYRIRGENINLLCSDVDALIRRQIEKIQIDPDQLIAVREHYLKEVHERIGYKHPDERSEIEANLQSINEEEKRAARLYAAGKITDQVWDDLWREWQHRRQTLKDNLDALEHKAAYHIDQLDDALHIISQIGLLYRGMELSDQKRLLKNIVSRVVVDAQGKLLRMELLPPFSYFRQISEKLNEESDSSENRRTRKTGSCSTKVLSSTPDRIRTCAFGSGGQRSIP